MALKVTIGLVIVNIVQPGKFITDTTRIELLANFQQGLPPQTDTGNLFEMLFDIIPEINLVTR